MRRLPSADTTIRPVAIIFPFFLTVISNMRSLILLYERESEISSYQRPTTVGSGMSSPSQSLLIAGSCTIPALGLNVVYSAKPVDWVNHPVLARPLAIKMRHVLPDP